MEQYLTDIFTISGKTPANIREIAAFFDLNGILPLIFKRQGNGSPYST